MIEQLGRAAGSGREGAARARAAGVARRSCAARVADSSDGPRRDRADDRAGRVRGRQRPSRRAHEESARPRGPGARVRESRRQRHRDDARQLVPPRRGTHGRVGARRDAELARARRRARLRDRLRAHPGRRSRSLSARDRAARADERQLPPRRRGRDGRREHGCVAARADHRREHRDGEHAARPRAISSRAEDDSSAPASTRSCCGRSRRAAAQRRRNSEASLGELLGGSTSQILYLTWEFSIPS